MSLSRGAVPYPTTLVHPQYTFIFGQDWHSRFPVLNPMSVYAKEGKERRTSMPLLTAALIQFRQGDIWSELMVLSSCQSIHPVQRLFKF